jgi:hypothetical protein
MAVSSNQQRFGLRGVSEAAMISLMVHGFLAFGFALLLAAPASGAARPQSLGTSNAPVLTDGSRFAAYKSAATELTVVDDARKRVFTVAIDSGCLPEEMTAVGLLLVSCPGSQASDYELRVLDLRRRTSATVPGVEPLYESYELFGRRWLAGESAASGRRIRIYLNWHTGQKRSFGEEGAGGTYTPRDLDHDALAPIAPPRADGRDFDRDPPFSVAPTRTRDRKVWSDLTLFRNGDERTLGARLARLDRCPRWCGSISIGAGLVTWSKGRVARVYAIRTRDRAEWRFKRVLTLPGTLGRAVRHTRAKVYVSVYNPDNGRFRLFAVRWH